MATQKKPAKKSGGVAKKVTVTKKAVSKKSTAKPVHKNSKKTSIHPVSAKAKTAVVKKSATKKVASKKRVAPKVGSPAKKVVKKSAKVTSVKTHKTKVQIVKKNNVKTPAKKELTKSVKKAATKKEISGRLHTEKVEEKQPQITTSRRRSTDQNKTVIYQPEFIKSVLDQPEQNNGPVFRYSDAELQEFRELILKKLEDAKKELVYLQGLITRKDETGTEDTENKYMSMEDGSGTMEREQLNQMASRQIQFIDHLEKALVRIENKTYGICRVTGKLIDKARLRAVPHATLSIEAKQAMNK